MNKLTGRIIDNTMEIVVQNCKKIHTAVVAHAQGEEAREKQTQKNNYQGALNPNLLRSAPIGLFFRNSIQ